MTWHRPKSSHEQILHSKTVCISFARAAEASPRHSIPVLYIPGAAGSKAQARSIASEAYRQFARSSAHEPGHAPFTVYTVHLNEELSAFDARLLSAQAQFVVRAIEWLHHEHPLPFVILIGHSMGEPFPVNVPSWSCQRRRGTFVLFHQSVSRWRCSTNCRRVARHIGRTPAHWYSFPIRSATACAAAVNMDTSAAAPAQDESHLPIDLSRHA